MSKKVSVTLLRDHTHAGIKCPAGSKIQVSALTRDWMLAQQIIRVDAEKQQEATDVK